MDVPWRPSSPPIDVDNFEEFLAHHRVVVIHFWAAWDQYDRVMDRRLSLLFAEFAGRIAFRSLDVDLPEGANLIRRSGLPLANVPALACFVGGGLVECLVGCRSTDDLRERLIQSAEAADPDGQVRPEP